MGRQGHFDVRGRARHVGQAERCGETFSGGGRKNRMLREALCAGRALYIWRSTSVLCSTKFGGYIVVVWRRHISRGIAVQWRPVQWAATGSPPLG